MTPENISNQSTSTNLVPVGNGYPVATVNSPLTVTPVTAIDSATVQASFPPSSEVSAHANRALFEFSVTSDYDYIFVCILLSVFSFINTSETLRKYTSSNAYKHL